MVNIILIDGVVEVKWDGECYQPHILRKGGHEARNPATGEMIIVSDRMIPHDFFSSNLKSVVKYVARELAAQDLKDTNIQLRTWLGVIDEYADKMTEALKRIGNH